MIPKTNLRPPFYSPRLLTFGEDVCLAPPFQKGEDPWRKYIKGVEQTLPYPKRLSRGGKSKLSKPIEKSIFCW